jgi:glutamate-1-semialdehyde 2,1-aminomutase
MGITIALFSPGSLFQTPLIMIEGRRNEKPTVGERERGSERGNMKRDRNRMLWKRAKRYLPGGVNSPVRAFGKVGGTPPFIKKAEGCRVWDENGKEYIDYVGSWGPMILGHAHPEVIRAVRRVTRYGTSFGAPTKVEVDLAKRVVELVPSVEVVRMVNSGTEATMSAIRLARGITGRTKLVKFGGCYHGHGDSFLIRAGSGALTFGVPDSPGVTPGTARDTVIASFNDLNSVQQLFEAEPGDIAAVIVEPVVGNMGCIPPQAGFLEGLRELATEYGALLIFDEVMTGFRVARGGAQERYGITPDLTTLGKVLGGGLPVGAYGGKRNTMKHVAPEGDIYQAGTLSGNPLAMTAGLETLKALAGEGVYETLEQRSAALEDGFADIIRRLGLPLTQNRVGSMFSLFFTPDQVIDYDTALRCDTERFARYFHEMLDRGIYLAPSQFEAGFVSLAHGPEEIEKTLQAAVGSLKAAFGK